jgi:hypothetical protein
VDFFKEIHIARHSLNPEKKWRIAGKMSAVEYEP